MGDLLGISGVVNLNRVDGTQPGSVVHLKDFKASLPCEENILGRWTSFAVLKAICLGEEKVSDKKDIGIMLIDDLEIIPLRSITELFIL